MSPRALVSLALAAATVLGVSSRPAFAAHPKASPVTVACVQRAARREKVPLAALVGLLRTERGRVGHWHENPGGSYDMGPMQINSSWLPILAKHHISRSELLYNGCINVLAGAWILRMAYLRHHNDWWAAIGAYHSGTSSLANGYKRRVWEHLKRIVKHRERWSEVVAYANRGLD